MDTKLGTLPNSQKSLLAFWLLTMISLPLIEAFLGRGATLKAVNLAVVVQAITVLVMVAYGWGWSKTLIAVAGVALFTWAIEAIGSHTGFPFGGYQYTEILQPKIFGVPVLIPLAWWMMLPPAWAVAQSLSTAFSQRKIAFLIFSALAFTAWDLFLDPQMAHWGLWQWDTPSGYFGIPWSSYLGWFFATLVITALLNPPDLPKYPLLLVYTLTWALESFGLAVFWGLVGPAVVGGLGMGVFIFWGWRSLRRK